MEKEKFWVVDHLGKCYIDEIKFKLFLENNGFFKRKKIANIYEVVKKNQNRLEVVNLFEIKYFVFKYIIENDINKYVFSVLNSTPKLFKINFLTELI